MPPVGRRSRGLTESEFPDITWEHSHVIVDDEGLVHTYCVYEARNAEQLAELLPQLGGEVLLAEPGRPYAKEFLERFRAEPVGERIYRLA